MVLPYMLLTAQAPGFFRSIPTTMEMADSAMMAPQSAVSSYSGMAEGEMGGGFGGGGMGGFGGEAPPPGGPAKNDKPVMETEQRSVAENADNAANPADAPPQPTDQNRVPMSQGTE